MKRILLFMALVSITAAEAISQSAYYYFNGNKIYIAENARKVCVVKDKKGNKTGASFQPSKESSGFKVSQTIKDNIYDITVYEAGRGNEGPPSLLKTMKEAAEADNAMVLPCYKNEYGDELVLTNYLNVELKKESDYPLLREKAVEYNLVITEQDKFMPRWYILSITPNTGKTSLEVANELYETGLFASSVADFSSNDLYCSYDPLVGSQWGLYNSNYSDMDISACAAWNYATGRNIKIGVLDQGIDMDHIDLVENVSSLSYDTETNTSPSILYGNHATHCAGIAAAVRNNGIHVAGVAPDAKLVSISNSLHGTTNSRIRRADGINWAWRNGVDVISNSWGSSTKHPAINQAIYNAFRYGREGKGCVIVFAAGNDYRRPVSYPANCNDTIIAVGAIAKTGSLAPYSNVGEKLDVVAPGSDILSTMPNNMTGEMDGTSMACPHVAGLAALILERNPSLRVTEVNDLIEKNTKKITVDYSVIKKNGSWNNDFGYGLIDAYKTLVNTPRR